ncbi:MAG: hypothetical protein JWQ89_500 [Devosia sp.]|uniref:type II toxin-antitoxin system toxin DNA ADP-ribosyl transferase DarT n=1 Tax=Devosia sp. TaxID=1871048 RepID=UPI002605C6D0|nr:DUF4433 domain-containing protein [Devosia sp.]MDB5538773.1 hypothetical protein [Devosia sp.]
MPAPAQPKIFHIAHVDRLASIAGDGLILSDVAIRAAQKPGTVIGMNNIKERRLTSRLSSYPDLAVGACAPFYFCPRSVMLFMIFKRNPELQYTGGQEPIVHLEGDLHRAITWANAAPRRWAFTLSNAGSNYFEDRADAAHLDQINWAAVANNGWGYNGVDRSVKEGKQAEFLMETAFPWHLVERITVHSQAIALRADAALNGVAHRPPIQVKRDWYY